MFIFIALTGLLLAYLLFKWQKQFGSKPSPESFTLFSKSRQFKKGIFMNEHETPILIKKIPFTRQLRMYFKKVENRSPSKPLPSVRTNLKSLEKYSFDHAGRPVIIWFGHSSYLIHIQGKNILVDPVFSGNISPLGLFGKNYPGTNPFRVEDFPDPDMVLITHDHFDHLDYETILKLKSRAKHFYTSLGVASHLVSWGVDREKITELDWWEEASQVEGIKWIAAPARHFSGRTFKRNRTLWSSFILETSGYRIYLGGDSGYDTHFKEIGERYGPFDLALLECGQYNPLWANIHMMPEETVQAALDLKSKLLLPVHWGKFTLSLHPWTDPIQRVTKEAALKGVAITTPMIGEPLVISEDYPVKHWWEGY